MQDSSTLDELDLALVNAVQIAPRGSWQVLGSVLGVDPSTVARRWQRINELGLVWMTAYARLTGLGDLLGERGARRVVRSGASPGEAAGNPLLRRAELRLDTQPTLLGLSSA
ncbi:AsnC family protein [Saccharopolyspora sp. 5N708]|uniref:AsnC family protein n=1 Tax=Saccharopolyspora sp. 5N708 TaxID=3457424 RepID=UPI003FD0C549